MHQKGFKWFTCFILSGETAKFISSCSWVCMNWQQMSVPPTTCANTAQHMKMRSLCVRKGGTTVQISYQNITGISSIRSAISEIIRSSPRLNLACTRYRQTTANKREVSALLLSYTFWCSLGCPRGHMLWNPVQTQCNFMLRDRDAARDFLGHLTENNFGTHKHWL